MSAIDTASAIVAGGTQGNNCGYSYTYDVTSGSGGFKKTPTTYQNTNSVSLCSDLVPETAPPPPPEALPFPVCSDPGETNVDEAITYLDETTALCGPDEDGDGLSDEKSVVCNFQLEQPNAGADIGEYCCVCGIAPGEQQVCVAGGDECDGVIGDDGEVPDGTKDVRIDGGEVFEFLETPGCFYSRALRRWTCV